jgi:carbonic anhydrase
MSVETSINPAGENLKAAYVNQSTVSYKVGGVDKTFNSLQFHWHHPSEHTVDGKYLDVELHIVHSNTDGSGKLAVTGLFFKVDKSMHEDILDKYNFFADGTSHPFTFPLFMKNHLVYHY